jgi:type I restriction enzyme S subunit
MKWELRTLGDLGEWGSGGTPLSSTPEYYNGTIPWLIIEDLNDGVVTTAQKTITEMGLKNSSAKIVEPGTLLIAMYGSIGKLGIAGIRCATNQAIAFCRHNPELVDVNFLFYYLLYSREKLLDLGKGNTQQNIGQAVLKEYPIPLPPLTEQKRIASLLAHADRLRQLRRTAHDLGDALLQSVFLEMFGDPQFNDKKWDLVTLGEKITFMTSGSRGWAEHYSDKGDLFLRIQNVGANQLLLDDVAYVQAPDTAESKRTKVQPGDLLISATADLGRTAVIPENFPTAYINQHLFLLRLKDLNPVYVAGYFSTPTGKAQILRLDREGVKSGLNFDDARSLTVFNPPLSLQEEFAGVVARVESLRGRMGESERQVEGLFESLLMESFS